MDNEIYLSLDIETDGPIPGLNNMRSIGIWAFRRNGDSLGTFSANLLPMPGRHPDPATMEEFWHKHPEAWAAATRNPENPLLVMRRLVDFISGIRRSATIAGDPPKIVIAAYPVAFDHAFLRHYLWLLLRSDIIGHTAFDIRSFAAGLLGTGYSAATKRRYPEEWRAADEAPLSHVALEDAIQQGKLLISMLNCTK